MIPGKRYNEQQEITDLYLMFAQAKEDTRKDVKDSLRALELERLKRENRDLSKRLSEHYVGGKN